MNSYKKWLSFTFVFLFSVLLSIAVFNYKVDSAGLFSHDNTMQQAAKAIVDGNIVAGLGDEAFDGRVFQTFLIKNINKKVDIIAIGSSRTKELRARYLEQGKYTFYNHAVNGASMEDYIAIIGMYYKLKGYLPKEVILGVDPWVFNQNNGRIRWHSIETYHNLFSDLFSSKKSDNSDKTFQYKKYKELLNYTYTITNIRFLLQRLRHKKKSFYIVKDINTDDFLRETDGSIQYPFGTRKPNNEAVKIQALQYTKGYVYGLENFQFADKKEVFQQFISFLKAQGVKVTLFLAPYHPRTFDILSLKPEYKLQEVQKYLEAFATTNQIQLLGSYNPHDLNLTENDFFDGMHCSDHVIQQIFSSWKH